MLRAGLSGCGKIGSEFATDAARIGIYTHAAAYDALANVALVAICDPSDDKRSACAVRYQIPSEHQYADFVAMLSCEKLDLLSIATPDGLHARQILLALQSQSVKGVLLEKPLALSCEEARQVIAAAKRSSVKILVNYSRRFCAAHQRVQQAIQSEQLGKVQTVQGVYTKGIRHNGTHWLDLVRWFFGDVLQIRAHASNASDYEGNPTPHVQLQMMDGTLVCLQALDHQAFSLFEMDVFFERGRIRIGESGHRIEWYGVAGSLFYTGYQTPTLLEVDQTGCQSTLLSAVQNLCAAVTDNQRLLCNADDAWHALLLAETAIKSMQQGGVWLNVNR